MPLTGSGAGYWSGLQRVRGPQASWPASQVQVPGEPEQRGAASPPKILVHRQLVDPGSSTPTTQSDNRRSRPGGLRSTRARQPRSNSAIPGSNQNSLMPWSSGRPRLRSVDVPAGRAAGATSTIHPERHQLDSGAAVERLTASPGHETGPLRVRRLRLRRLVLKSASRWPRSRPNPEPFPWCRFPGPRSSRAPARASAARSRSDWQPTDFTCS